MISPGASAGRLARDFAGFAEGRLWALAALMLAGSVAEAIGIVTLVPLVALVSDPGSLPPVIAGLVGGAAKASRTSLFVAALGIFLAAMAVRALLLYGRDLLSARLAQEYDADLKLRAATSLADMGWGKASRVGLSGMQSLLLTEIPRCVLAVHEGLAAAIAGIMLLVQFSVAVLLSPTMAGIVFAVLTAGVLLSWRWLKASSRRGAAISTHGERSGAAGFRFHAGLKAAIAQGTTVQFLGEYGRSLRQLADEVVGFGKDRARARALASLAAAFAAAGLVLIGQQWLHLPFTVLATLLLLFARMSGPAYSLQQASQSYAAHSAAFAAIESSLGPVARRRPAQTRSARPLDWQRLELRAVSFSHPESGFRIADATASLDRGEWLGIAGPSGGGKTTLIDLVAMLIEPESGEAVVDGQRISPDREAGWRRGLAYVGQSEMTFDDSIRQNLLAGSDERHSDEELWSALELVGLADRVRILPEGLEAQAGDRGSSLSGGERQRLAIARAVLRRPTLLILDEATNALDPDSEEQVIRRLQTIEPRPAALVIAHRQRPLDLCDRVVRMDNGRLS